MIMQTRLLYYWCGFFRRALYFRTMPKYHGVKMCREQRFLIDDANKKKHWITNWTNTPQ